MYNYITGKLIEKTTEYIVLDVNGIGYELYLSKRDLCKTFVDDVVTVYTHLNVKEDEMSLIGFLEKNDKIIFRRLIDVSGIGVKSAIGILSMFSAEELIMALETGDVNLISKCPGVGKKTAQRIVLELQGKLVITTESKMTSDTESMKEAFEAMKSLGFNDNDIKKVFNNIEDIDRLDTQDIIKLALKRVNNA